MLRNCLAISDLCTYSKSSLSVAITALEAQRVEACPLVTSVLSTQSDGFDELYQVHLDHTIGPIYSKLKGYGVVFDGVYSGFLSNVQAFEQVRDILQRSKSSVKLVDPVLGDDGTLYSISTQAMVEAMRSLVSLSDIITPNQTEAFLLLDIPYKKQLSGKQALGLVKDLKGLGPKAVVITGLHMDDNSFALATENALIHYSVTHRTLPGSGDLFASILMGSILRGMEFLPSVRRSSDLVSLCIERTCEAGYEPSHGVCPALILDKLFI